MRNENSIKIYQYQCEYHSETNISKLSRINKLYVYIPKNNQHESVEDLQQLGGACSLCASYYIMSITPSMGCAAVSQKCPEIETPARNSKECSKLRFHVSSMPTSTNDLVLAGSNGLASYVYHGSSKG